MPFLRPRKKEPSYEERLNMQKEAGEEVGELQDMSYGQLAIPPFDARVLQDDEIQKFFEPNSRLFDEILLPFKPYTHTVLYITLLTDDEIREFEHDVDITAEQCFSLARTREQHIMIQSIENYLRVRIKAARRGFLLTTLTSLRKTLTVMRGEEKKKWWPF